MPQWVPHGYQDTPDALVVEALNLGWRPAEALEAQPFACLSSGSIVALSDHHRSHEPVVRFSNEFFYGGRLCVTTDYKR